MIQGDNNINTVGLKVGRNISGEKRKKKKKKKVYMVESVRKKKAPRKNYRVSFPLTHS